MLNFKQMKKKLTNYHYQPFKFPFFEFVWLVLLNNSDIYS
jgi:hypothetical protein